MDPQPTTRERLIDAATSLFAERGFRGADIRSICNIARVNPGAVSYHFGGKRQLYRAVMRAAVDRLAAAVSLSWSHEEPPSLTGRVAVLYRELSTEPNAARLLQRDLADGGQMAIEALAPVLRSARAAIATATGDPDEPARRREINRIVLEIAAPLWLAVSAWTVFERSLQMDEADRQTLADSATGVL